MLKPLLFILVLVMIIALVLNLDFFTNSKKTNAIIQDSVKKEILTEVIPEVVTPSVSDKNTLNEHNLSQELTTLLHKAQMLLRQNKNAEALLVYEKIIEKSQNSLEVKILKIFADACLKKATLHYSYPSFDIDSAIESYEIVVNKLKNSTNKELLIIYMQARIQQTSFNSKDEMLVTYDELIDKFTNDKEQRFEKEIEELLFSKSFALMGINDEEAIEVLDSIIAKYKDKDNLPETVKFSILNNIELSIITSNDSEKYVDLANQYMADSPDTKPLLDMLSIIKNAQDLEQNEALEQWNAEHNAYNFPDWDFSELRKWVNKMETPESQTRIRQYLDIFEKQKYKNPYQTQAPTVPINPIYSDEATQNIDSNPYEPVDDTSQEEVTYEEVPTYEPDPYLSDIINTQSEISYPNPNSNYEPNIQTDGVTHNYADTY